MNKKYKYNIEKIFKLNTKISREQIIPLYDMARSASVLVSINLKKLVQKQQA